MFAMLIPGDWPPHFICSFDLSGRSSEGLAMTFLFRSVSLRGLDIAISAQRLPHCMN